MIHFAHTSTQLAAVVRPVRLVLAARGAPQGPAIRLADEDIFCVEALQPNICRNCGAYSSRVRASLHVRVCLACLLRIGFARAVLPTPALRLLFVLVVRHFLFTEGKVPGIPQDLVIKMQI